MSENRFWYLFSMVLTHEATQQEVDEYEQLKAKYPHLAYQADYLSRYWNSSSPTQPDPDAEAVFEHHWKQISQLQPVVPINEESQNRKVFSLRRKVSIMGVAACLLIICVGFLWNHNLNSENRPFLGRKYGEVSTKAGTRTKVILPDSTIVWLNAGSKFSYSEAFGIKDRNTVLSGEAFFDVRKSTIPFVIHANNITIKVLGTAFNVRSYENEKTTETSLIRGRVEVTMDKRPGETFLLKPNEKLVVSNEPKSSEHKKSTTATPIIAFNKLQPDIDNTLPETAWLDNKLVFQNESFEDLARQMERWYGVAVEFKDDVLKEQHLSGSFTNESLAEALEALQLTTRFHFKIKQNTVTITK